MFLILGLIFSIITILVMKDMKIYVKECCKLKPIYIHSWEVFLLCLFYFVPIFGIIVFIGLHIWFLVMYYGGDTGRTIVELSEKNIFHKIFLKVISALTKPINQ